MYKKGLVYMQNSQSFTRDQKEAVGLLSIGTFLEYFDLMLYVHMAVLLNELFFPKTDPHIASLLSAFAFCSTYLLRPVGALLFGWIGDNIGRKTTVIITTALMSLSCVVMANLPTYSQIGVTAAWIVSICRIVQGMTSMGEITGAQLYLSEYLKPPAKYVGVAMMNLCAALGTFGALGIAFFTTAYAMNWRLAFWFGAGIAFVGMIARTALRETPEFVDAKKRLQNSINKFKQADLDLDNNSSELIDLKQKVDFKTSLSLLLVDCMWPVCFYFSYIHCANILKHTFSYSAESIIQNNFIISAVVVLNVLIVVNLSYKFHPLRILKIKLICSAITFFAAPLILLYARTGYDVSFVQAIVLFFACDASPGNAVFFKYFPVFRRFTYSAFIYALSRALVYVVTSVSLIYLTDYFGHLGLFFVIVPTFLGFIYGIRHFIMLEEASGQRI
jgi:MFS family permease